LGKRKPPEPGAAEVQERGPGSLRRVGTYGEAITTKTELIDAQPEEPPLECSGVGVGRKGSGS